MSRIGSANSLIKSNGIGDFLAYSGFDVFFHHVPETALNPFLGTMQVELLGSILVFCYLLMDHHVRFRSIVLLLISHVFLLATGHSLRAFRSA